jgi:hypothetical protein
MPVDTGEFRKIWLNIYGNVYILFYNFPLRERLARVELRQTVGQRTENLARQPLLCYLISSRRMLLDLINSRRINTSGIIQEEFN